MESLANQDGLTSTFNRRAFDDRIHFIRNFSMRYDNKNESTASLIMFDIDNFKQINDTQGHREGDQILINLSKLELAERMRKILEESSVSTFTKVTASFGVAEYNQFDLLLSFDIALFLYFISNIMTMMTTDTM